LTSAQIYWIVFGGVIVMWFSFAVVFWVRKKPPKAAEQKRDRASLYGILLQGVAYGFVWSLRHPVGGPIVPLSRPLELVLVAVTLVLGALSVWITVAAVRTLGKQWSYQARIVEGHRLVTEGPYRIVRNPIYSGMLGMLVATALANSHWIGLLAAVVVFWIGAKIRISSEEKLLREAFGADFTAYARRVPALVPWFR
jgi:protein-S-isoprenylcysteine O-methyltransferase Ste14